MAVDSTLFPPFLVWLVGILYVGCLIAALRMAPWSRFRDSEQLHVFLGTVVVLVVFRPHWVYSFSDEQYLKGK